MKYRRKNMVRTDPNFDPKSLSFSFSKTLCKVKEIIKIFVSHCHLKLSDFRYYELRCVSWLYSEDLYRDLKKCVCSTPENFFGNRFKKCQGLQDETSHGLLLLCQNMGKFWISVMNQYSTDIIHWFMVFHVLWEERTHIRSGTQNKIIVYLSRSPRKYYLLYETH